MTLDLAGKVISIWLIVIAFGAAVPLSLIGFCKVMERLTDWWRSRKAA